MLIATFGPDSGWAGRKITREGDTFSLEGHGPITAKDVMEYDGQGHLVWPTEGTRALVGSISGLPCSTQAAQAHWAVTPSQPTPAADAPVSAEVRGRLDKVRAQTSAGDCKRAVENLWHVEVAMRSGEYGVARDLADLAAELQWKTQKGLRDECTELIERAQTVLESKPISPPADPLAVSFPGARFLGFAPWLQESAGRAGEGVLWFTTHWIGIGNEAGQLRQDAAVQMSAVAAVEVTGKQAKKSGGDVAASLAIGGLVGFAATGGLSVNATNVAVHTRGGDAMHFEIVEHKATQVHSPLRGVDWRPEQIRSAIAPLLRSLGVALRDQPGEPTILSPAPQVPGPSVDVLSPARESAAPQDDGSSGDADVNLKLVDALARLAELHEKGALSDVEYAAAKAKLLL